jgi:hypothetical protein
MAQEMCWSGVRVDRHTRDGMRWTVHDSYTLPSEPLLIKISGTQLDTTDTVDTEQKLLPERYMRSLTAFTMGSQSVGRSGILGACLLSHITGASLT